MKRVLIALLFTCVFFVNAYGDESADWVAHRKKIVKMLPVIPGWCPMDKATRMMDLIYTTKPDVCVEVGIFGGSSFIPTASAMQFNKKGVGYAIDPWDNAPCMDGQTGEHLDWWKKVDLRAIFIGFVDQLHRMKLDNRVALMRMTSKDALPFFQNSSIDIIHIDGNHSEDNAYFDATNWLPKVKVGGYIWFDDTDWTKYPTTKKAVDYLLQYCELGPAAHIGDGYLVLKKVRSES